MADVEENRHAPSHLTGRPSTPDREDMARPLDWAPSASRILVIGATGQVGRELISELTRHHSSIEVLSAARSHPDPARRVNLEQPDTIERLILSDEPSQVILAAASHECVVV